MASQSLVGDDVAGLVQVSGVHDRVIGEGLVPTRIATGHPGTSLLRVAPGWV
jgi:hypothetical protein